MNNDPDSLVIPHKVVHVLQAQQLTGHVLISKLPRGHRSEGLWGVTCAGHMHEGEMVAETVRRLVETKLDLPCVRDQYQFVQKFVMKDEGREKTIYLFTYLADTTPRVNEYADERRWVSWAGLLNLHDVMLPLLTPTFLHILRHYNGH